MQCNGNTSCNTVCQKQCNTTVCNSKNCSMVCEPNSQCPAVSCGSKTDTCQLECREGATCNLNCTVATSCTHSCAKTGLCRTLVGNSIDLHDGTCGRCNCSSDIRNCTQRCEDATKRCLKMYCNARDECKQFSSTIGKSFVYRMRSYAPTIKQVFFALVYF